MILVPDRWLIFPTNNKMFVLNISIETAKTNYLSRTYSYNFGTMLHCGNTNEPITKSKSCFCVGIVNVKSQC